MQHFTKALIGHAFRTGRPPREKDRDHDRRHLHQRQQRGHITLHGRSVFFQIGDRCRERHRRYRTVVRGDGPGIYRTQAAAPAQDPKAPHRNGHAEQQRSCDRLPDLAEGDSVQLHTAFQPDGKQQINAQGSINFRRNFQIAAHQSGQHPKGKGQDHGSEETGRKGLKDIHGRLRERWC